MQLLSRVAENLWELSRPLKAPGLRVGHRMTVARLASGELWIHSPVSWDSGLEAELKTLGPPRHFIAPSVFHDLYWPEWLAHFREATFYCAPGMKLSFDRVLSQSAGEPWENELPKVMLRGMPKLNEFVFLHHASRTLIVTDLLFNFDIAKQSFLGKLFLKLNGIYGRPGCSRLFRRFIKNRAAFRQSISEIMMLDFDRVVLAHGSIIESGGKTVFERSFEWLRE